MKRIKRQAKRRSWVLFAFSVCSMLRIHVVVKVESMDVCDCCISCDGDAGDGDVSTWLHRIPSPYRYSAVFPDFVLQRLGFSPFLRYRILRCCDLHRIPSCFSFSSTPWLLTLPSPIPLLNDNPFHIRLI